MDRIGTNLATGPGTVEEEVGHGKDGVVDRKNGKADRAIDNVDRRNAVVECHPEDENGRPGIEVTLENANGTKTTRKYWTPRVDKCWIVPWGS